MGYSTKKGVINVDVSKGAKPLRQMNEEESEAHVMGDVLSQMYILRKGTELFGEKAEQATMTELSQIDDFETYLTPSQTRSQQARQKRRARVHD